MIPPLKGPARGPGDCSEAHNRVAQTEAEREGIWRARRRFGHVLIAMRKNFFAEDVAVPIAEIPEMIRRVQELARATGLRIVTVGHAGDGNLHPTILFDRELFAACGLRYDESYGESEDYELVTRVLGHADADNLGEPLVLKRGHQLPRVLEVLEKRLRVVTN